MMVNLLQIGREILLAESKALQSLANYLNTSFEDVVNLFFKTQGRIIVSGMGKSGHVGCKIAATFASTGQPASFVHAAEAGHGDLGMITKNDTLLLISYTGETKELSPIIDYAHRFSIPVVAITGKRQSTLAKLSNFVLALPQEPEACPMGLAPTTSTTMTIALGDALAVALLKKRGFSSQDFHTFHPKGSLGHQLQRIKSVMHKHLPLVECGTSMQEAILMMSSKGLGCVGVINDHLIGIITDGDLRRHMSPQLLEKSVEDVMTKNPVTLTEDHIIADALRIMSEKNITNLFVINENQHPVGIVHIHDCV